MSKRQHTWLIALDALYGERANAQKKHLAVAVEVTAYLLSCVMVEISARSAQGQDPNDPTSAEFLKSQLWCLSEIRTRRHMHDK